MKHHISRRSLLRGGSAAALATMAGCRVSAESAEDAGRALPTVAPTPTAVPSPTATSVPRPTATAAPTPTSEPGRSATPEPVSGEAVQVLSAARDDAPQQALIASLEGFQGAVPNVDFDPTFDYQDLILQYLDEPYDVLSWFSGYRNREFAQDGLVLDVSDVWEQSPRLLSGARAPCTAADGLQYLVPTSFYTWAINYSQPVFEANDWVPPASFDELLGLADDMAAAGIVPFALANDGRWPAMATFDMLNMRVNGYEFHRNVLAGRESFVDGRVKDVFTQWEQLLPYQQEDPNERTWQQAGTDLADGTAGMYLMGTFAVLADDRLIDDMDFFNAPAIDQAIGAGAIDAPLDGFMLSGQTSDADEARRLLAHMASGASQQAAAAIDGATLYTNLGARPGTNDRIQRRSLELAAQSEVMASFLDRETTGEFALSCGEVIAAFLENPSSIDDGLQSLEDLSAATL